MTVIVAAIGLVAVAPAHAEFQGTPGKIAYVDGSGDSSQYPLKIWDPMDLSGQVETTLVASTFRSSTGTEVDFGEPSAPVFSPDGTKIAYSALVFDATVNGNSLYHTAIFTMNVDGSDQQQVTSPDHFAAPSCDSCTDGHDVADFAPAWSPDGSQIAFIREVSAGDSDPLVGERVQNIWSVIPGGSGGPEQLTQGGQSTIFQSVVWGSGSMVTAYTDSGGLHLGTLPPAGGTPTAIADPITINDYDISPDGQHVAYSTPFANHVVGIDGSNDTELAQQQQFLPISRYSPTGNGALQFDCGDYLSRTGSSLQRCGIFEAHTNDPGGNIRPDDPPDRLVLDWTKLGGVISPFAGRAMWDVQAQQVPVIFAPGFLASTITACGDTPWPPNGLNRSEMHEMDLQPDGETNAECADAGPDGNPAGTIIRTILSTDVTDTLQNHLQNSLLYPASLGPNGTAEQGRPFPVTYFGWDWRRRAQDSVDKLDTEVDQVLQSGPLQQAEGVDRVVLAGHSYGGLLMLSYATQHPERVARILTIGTPYWGAPKVIFPLAFGRETPFFGAMDILTDKTQMQVFARDLAGLYELFPSQADFGPWLTVSGQLQDQDGVSSEVLSLGGQPTLYGKAQTDHADTFDGFNDGGGQVDYQVVAGGGLPTPGAVSITPTAPGQADVRVTMVNGDATVPLRSAVQGSVDNPLGARVHIQVRCGVGHMDEPNDAEILGSYTDWLLDDRTPRALDGTTCSDPGGVLEFKDKTGLTFFDSSASTTASPSAPTRRTAAPVAETSLEDAWNADDIDVYDLDPQVFVVMSDYHPVNLGIDVSNETFTYTPIEPDSSEGTPLSYGPLTGHLVVSPGIGGGDPTVTVDGLVVAGAPITSGGGGSSTSGGTSGGTPGTSGGSAPAGSAGTSSASGDDQVERAVATSLAGQLKGLMRKLASKLGRADVAPFKLALNTAAAGAGTLTVTTVTKTRPRTVATGHYTSSKAGTTSVRITIPGKGRAALRAAAKAHRRLRLKLTLGFVPTVGGRALSAVHSSGSFTVRPHLGPKRRR